MMIYSKTCEYAIRALSYLASKRKRAFTMIPEVSKETGVPGPYIAKIFQGLVRKGILKSRRGPTGGFDFKKEPQDISLLEIVKAVDDIISLKEDCIMGLDQCNAANACPLHFVWERAKERMLNRLDKSSLADVTKKVGKMQYRELKRAKLNEALGLGVA